MENDCQPWALVVGVELQEPYDFLFLLTAD